MPLPTYSTRAIRIAQLAGRRAARSGAKKVEPEHLLVALLGDKTMLSAVFIELEIDPAALLVRARAIAGIGPRVSRTKPRISARMERILSAAQEEGLSFAFRKIDVEHLLLALVREGGAAAGLLAELGATYDAVRMAIRTVLHLPPPARCPACGYDLRATPLRCPECGRVI